MITVTKPKEEEKKIHMPPSHSPLKANTLALPTLRNTILAGVRRRRRDLAVLHDARLALLGLASEHGRASVRVVAQLRHDGGVCAVDGPDLEQAVHLLERDRLGLGHQEEDEDDRDEHERREEEVDAVAPLLKHGGGEARDDKVPEPVVGGGVGLAEGAGGGKSCVSFFTFYVFFFLSWTVTEAGWGGRNKILPSVLVKHLRVDDPGSAVPRRSVKGSPQVKEKDGGDTTWRQTTRVGVLFRLGDLDVGTNEP